MDFHRPELQVVLPLGAMVTVDIQVDPVETRKYVLVTNEGTCILRADAYSVKAAVTISKRNFG